MRLTKDEEETWEVLRSPWWVSSINNNHDLVSAIMHGKTTGITLDVLAEYFVTVATDLAKMKKYASYSFKEDMISSAVVDLLGYYTTFDKDRGTDPNGYLVFACHSSFVRFIARNKKEQQIIEYLEEQELCKNNFVS